MAWHLTGGTDRAAQFSGLPSGDPSDTHVTSRPATCVRNGIAAVSRSLARRVIRKGPACPTAGRPDDLVRLASRREALRESSAGPVIGPAVVWRSIVSPALPDYEVIDCGAVWDTPILLVDVRFDGSSSPLRAMQVRLAAGGLRSLALVRSSGAALVPDDLPRLDWPGVLDASAISRSYVAVLSSGMLTSCPAHERLMAPLIISPQPYPVTIRRRRQPDGRVEGEAERICRFISTWIALHRV